MMALTRINNNISALNAIRSLNATSADLQVSLERLSSGLRINRAADDAAGLTISENLRSQINGLNQAIDNASTAINLINTAEGALSETTARLQRIRTLAVQAANTGTNDSIAIQAIQDEIRTSIEEITRIGADTQFANRRLLNGAHTNTATFLGGTGLGIRLSTQPTSSTLSSGYHFLSITQTNAGSETLTNGVDGVNNSGATGFTGSTFDSGTYDLAVSNVVAAAARQVSTSGTISATDGTVLLDGLNIDGYAIDQADDLRFTIVQSDGTTVNANVVVGAANTINDVLTALNGAVGTDTVTYDTANGKFVVTAAAAGTNTNLSITMAVDDEAGGAPYEKTLTNEVIVAGNDNTATVTFGGGASQAVTAGQTVSLYGPTPSDVRAQKPEITLTFGATLTAGTDTVTIVAQSYAAFLNGGSLVTFQNGDRNVSFQTGTSAGTPAGESLILDFDAVIDLGGGTARTFVLSAVNNALNFQIGANAGQNVKVAFGDMRADNLGFVGETQPNGNARTVAGINVTTLTGANEALAIVDEAIRQVNTQRSALGAFTNRLEATIANLGVASENLTSAESRIRDSDIAAETTRYTRSQILLQAGVSVLAQANSAPQNVLSLLQNIGR